MFFREWISVKQLMANLRLKLRKAFPKSEDKIETSIEMMKFIGKDSKSAPSIGEALNLTPVQCSRILNKLKTANFVEIDESKPVTGNINFWKLKIKGGELS